MAHIHSVYDTDLHFIIDPITRKITSQSGKVMLMQNDHNSERFTFQLPRYIEEHDMTACNAVEVHYINIDSVTKQQNLDVYPVEDFQTSPESEEVVIGSWLVSQNATKFAGSLSFILRFACLSDEQEIEYQWFTDVCSIVSITKGLYNAGAITDDNNYDILAAWKKEVLELSSANASTLDGHDSSYFASKEDLLSYIKHVDLSQYVVNNMLGNLTDDICNNPDYETPYVGTIDEDVSRKIGLESTQHTILYVPNSEDAGYGVQVVWPSVSSTNSPAKWRSSVGVTWNDWRYFYDSENKPLLSELEGVVSIAHGGTNATNASDARANLEITPVNISAVPDRVNISSQTLDVNTLTGIPLTSYITTYICLNSGGSANITNIPVSNTPFTLDVEVVRRVSNSDYVTRQRFVNNSDKKEYVRWCTNGTWGDWRYILDSKMSAIDISAADRNYRRSVTVGTAGTAYSGWLEVGRIPINGTSITYGVLLSVKYSQLGAGLLYLRLRVGSTNGVVLTAMSKMEWLAKTANIPEDAFAIDASDAENAILYVRVDESYKSYIISVLDEHFSTTAFTDPTSTKILQLSNNYNLTGNHVDTITQTVVSSSVVTKISDGGTGANTAEEALSNLGGVSYDNLAEAVQSLITGGSISMVKKVQRGTHTADEGESTVTITSVNTNKAFVIASFANKTSDPTDDSMAFYNVQYELASSTQIKFKNSGMTCTGRWQVIEFY